MQPPVNLTGSALYWAASFLLFFDRRCVLLPAYHMIYNGRTVVKPRSLRSLWTPRFEAKTVKMSDKDYAPLSASCVRALSDKLYEKRKVAALEIERYVQCLQIHHSALDLKDVTKSESHISSVLPFSNLKPAHVEPYQKLFLASLYSQLECHNPSKIKAIHYFLYHGVIGDKGLPSARGWSLTPPPSPNQGRSLSVMDLDQDSEPWSFK